MCCHPALVLLAFAGTGPTLTSAVSIETLGLHKSVDDTQKNLRQKIIEMTSARLGLLGYRT